MSVDLSMYVSILYLSDFQKSEGHRGGRLDGLAQIARNRFAARSTPLALKITINITSVVASDISSGPSGTICVFFFPISRDIAHSTPTEAGQTPCNQIVPREDSSVQSKSQKKKKNPNLDAIFVISNGKPGQNHHRRESIDQSINQ